MRPLQKLVASDGYEVMLFPLPYMYISQGELETYSHAGILAMDFMGWGTDGRIYHAPLFAPCSCKCVGAIDENNKGRVFESLNPVHTPSGLQYVTFMCFHDNTPIASVGDTFNQGEIFAHTGTAGEVSGDHTHFNTANGKYAGWENVPPDNNGELINSNHIYDICYVNDTVLSHDYDYNWQEYTGEILDEKKKHKFPWFIYARKLRDKRY